MPDRSRRRRPRWRRPLTLGVAAAVVLVGGGGSVAWAMSGRTADRWTTATVAMGSVQQTVSATGTVASASRRDVSFPVAGTVASVKVGLGDAVTAGQVLASLDATSLQSTLDQASSTLQQAQQQLSDDLASQTASTSSATSSASTSGSPSAAASSSSASRQTSTSGSSSSGPSPEVAKAGQDVATAQQALLAAYDDARTAIGASTQALTDAQAACTGITGLDASTVTADAGTPTSSPTATASPTADPSATPTPTPTSSAPTVSQVQALIAACQAKLTAASQAQADTKTKQQAVSDAAAALDQAVAALQKALGSSGATGTGTGSSGTGTSGQGGTQGSATQPAPAPTATAKAPSTAGRSGSSSVGSSAASQGRVATAVDILSDRAAIDAAQAQVDIATQDLALVNLTSPIAGTVGAVSITAGQRVSASSTSAVITVLGTDGYVVNLTVPLTSMERVAVGQSATTLVPSTATPLTGKVSSIGVLDVSTTSTPEYKLVVALDATQEKLFDGAAAQVSIEVAATGQVITVPTSAVHVSGQSATVQVLANGQVTDVPVQRGAVGGQLTEITSGLTVGQSVVLADRSQQLPSSSTNQGSGLSGLTSRSTTRIGVGGTVGFAPGGGTFRGNGG